MYSNKKFIFSLIIIIFSSLFFYSLERYVDFDLIKKAESPRFLSNGILFTLPCGYGEKVFLRTNLDNWEKNYYFKPSLYDILYVFIPYNLRVNNIKYKINIDGFWETDMYNSECVEDMLNTKLSVLPVPKEAIYHLEMPIIEKIGDKIKSVAFKYYNPDAKEVNFVCSIDNWCQYSHSMKKNKNGYWEISKGFSRGIYVYFFFVDGKKIIDLENRNRLWDEIRGQVSYFVVDH